LRDRPDIDQEDMVEIASHRRQIVMHRDHRLAGRPQVFQHIDDRPFGGGVHPGKGLVQQVKLRLLRQRPGQEHPLLLAARQLPDLAMPEIGHADPRQAGLRPGAMRAADAADQAKLGIEPHQHHIAHGGGKSQSTLARCGT
jgi:hypothetical protein